MELPQTVALPASCNYELPPSLPDSARCYYVSVSPSNNQSTSAIAFPPTGGTAFVANSGCAQSPFTNIPFNFDIPCSGGASTFVDTTSSTINGRLVVVVSTAGVAAGGSINLINSMASFFKLYFYIHQILL